MEIEKNENKLFDSIKLIYESQNKRNFEKISIEIRNRRYKKLQEACFIIYISFFLSKKYS